jgi:hypothetical protein
MNFGSDFNSSKPEDSGFVRHPSLRQLATEIRDLKTRIVSFFSTCFNLSTGNLNSASIPMTALIESKDKPSSGNLGYYEVTVNAKGFVVSGNVNPPSAATSIFRAVFIGDEGFIETPTGTIKQTTTSSEIYGVPCPAFTDINSTRSSKGYKYGFIVPEGVTKILVQVISGTVSSTQPASKYSRGYPTVPGEELTIFCGEETGTSFVASGPVQNNRFPQYVTSEYDASPDDLFLTPWISPGFSPYKIPTTGTLRKGIVILEWYA